MRLDQFFVRSKDISDHTRLLVLPHPTNKQNASADYFFKVNINGIQL